MSLNVSLGHINDLKKKNQNTRLETVKMPMLQPSFSARRGKRAEQAGVGVGQEMGKMDTQLNSTSNIAFKPCSRYYT